WFANTVHAASPAGWSHFDDDRWELFHIDTDRSQCHDLAAENPDKLSELVALWFAEAEKYNGLPIADLNIFETISRWRPSLAGERQSYVYYPGTADVGVGAGVEIRGRSFAVLAEVRADSADVEGVVVKHGGAHGGYVMYVQSGRLHFCYNFLGEQEQTLWSTQPVPQGAHTLGFAFTVTGTVEGSHTPVGDAVLYVDGSEVAARSGMRAVPATFGLAGATLSVGRNSGSPVSSAYRSPFPFTGGTIAQVKVDVSGAQYSDLERDFARAFARD
ncbi:MAG TPA: arylsulfatase, partial [Mycobacterium sp.]|nr:arylsulfatase [Mycobacterium sp.]